MTGIMEKLQLAGDTRQRRETASGDTKALHIAEEALAALLSNPNVDPDQIHGYTGGTLANIARGILWNAKGNGELDAAKKSLLALLKSQGLANLNGDLRSLEKVCAETPGGMLAKKLGSLNILPAIPPS
jgi:hypothetical protein